MRGAERPVHQVHIPDFDSRFPIYARLFRLAHETEHSCTVLDTAIAPVADPMPQLEAPDDATTGARGSTSSAETDSTNLLQVRADLVRRGAKHPGSRRSPLPMSRGRPVATPCRSWTLAPSSRHPAASATVLRLTDLIPMPRSGLCFGIDRGILSDLMRPYACSRMSGTLPGWEGLPEPARVTVSSLPLYQADVPLDCLFLYMDPFQRQQVRLHGRLLSSEHRLEASASLRLWAMYVLIQVQPDLLTRARSRRSYTREL